MKKKQTTTPLNTEQRQALVKEIKDNFAKWIDNALDEKCRAIGFSGGNLLRIAEKWRNMASIEYGINE